MVNVDDNTMRVFDQAETFVWLMKARLLRETIFLERIR
jgi:hypothetical protein